MNDITISLQDYIDLSNRCTSLEVCLVFALLLLFICIIALAFCIYHIK